MQRKDRIDALGATVLIVFSALLGLNQALVKLVNEGLAPVFQAGLRSAVALPFVLAFALILGRRLTMRDGSFWPGVACGLLFAGEFMLLFLSLEYTTIARVSILFYTMPIWVALAAHFLIPGETMTQARAIGLALAVAGVALALSQNWGDSDPDAWIGDLMALAGSTMWAAIALLARLTPLNRARPEMQLVYQLLFSAPVMLGFALIDGELVRDLTATHVAIFLFQCVVIVAAGFMTWFWILSIYPASDMASFGFLAPLFGVLAGWLIFGETLTPAIVGALALVGAGIVLVNRKPPRAPA